jgi:uncharacterized protein (TIGR01319 family)
MNYAALIDFGSTFTKVALVDLEAGELIARHQSPSTVKDNIMAGLHDAISMFSSYQQLNLHEARKFACSSAAGGLKVIAVGLVPALTVEAAKRAALGAGAKIVASYSYELTEKDLHNIFNQSADLILLTGGTDGGNRDSILHNAECLAKIDKDIPFIVAGNRVVNDKAAKLLTSSGHNAWVTENILPSLDELNVDPARQLIREIFMSRIVKAKGLDGAQEYVGKIIMPTPMATLEAARLVASGVNNEAGLGELVVVEVGGATTNVHSIATGYPTRSILTVKGLPEPFAKRTVEGDLGIRYNAQTILEKVGEDTILKNFLNCQDIPDKFELKEMINKLVKNTGFLPVSEIEHLLDAALARSAVSIAVERHCGTVKEVPTMHGPSYLLYGKDLSNIKTVIGAGGIFSNGRYPREILEASLFNKENINSLKPTDPEFFIDKEYLLYGIGLLAKEYSEKALNIAKRYIKPI